MQSSDLGRDRETHITWVHFDSLCRTLAVMVRGYDPQVVVGIAKGGVLPATVIASILRREFYPIRLSRRHDGEVVRETPELLLGPPPAIADQRVLLVDDVVATGRTMELARKACLEQSASEIRTASLCAHRWDHHIDYVAFTSHTHIIFPWEHGRLEGTRAMSHAGHE